MNRTSATSTKNIRPTFTEDEIAQLNLLVEVCENDGWLETVQQHIISAAPFTEIPTDIGKAVRNDLADAKSEDGTGNPYAEITSENLPSCALTITAAISLLHFLQRHSYDHLIPPRLRGVEQLRSRLAAVGHDFLEQVLEKERIERRKAWEKWEAERCENRD